MAWQEFPIIGFAPDLPSNTPGNILATKYCIPTEKGIAHGPVLNDYSSSAVNSASMGGGLVSDTSATEELIVGTATKLYGMPTSGTTLTDRSGAAYNATSTNTWSVTQFGNKVLAVNLGDQLQQRTIGAAANFASVGTAPVPKASIVITAGPTSAPFVVVFDYNDGTNVDRDGWKCSAISDYTGWTAGTNQCATGRLLDNIPGPITAAIPYRDGIVAWKATGMYVGSYTGAPYIWSWQRVSADIGCMGKNMCVEANDVIYFANTQGVWMYDGSYPRKVPGNVHKWWSDKFANINYTSSANYCRCVWDKTKNVIWFLGGDSSTPALAGGLAFNTTSGLWLCVQNGAQPFTDVTETLAAQEMLSARYTVNNSSLKVGQLTFAATSNLNVPASSISLWLMGDYVNTPIVKGVRPHLSTGPTLQNLSLSGTIYSQGTPWLALPSYAASTVGTSIGTLTGRSGYLDYLDGMGSAQYMQIQLSVSPTFEITGFGIDLSAAGKK